MGHCDTGSRVTVKTLRTMLGISWRDHITNDELMRRAGMGDLSNIAIDTGRAYAATIRQASKCGYATGT